MRLINQRAGQFPGNGPVVNNFLGTAYGGWRVYMGEPAQPGDPALIMAFNERTGMVVTGLGRGLLPHPTIPGQSVLQLQNMIVIFPEVRMPLAKFQAMNSLEGAAYLDGLNDERPASAGIAIHMAWLERSSSFEFFKGERLLPETPVDMLLLYKAAAATFEAWPPSSKVVNFPPTGEP